jgi:hypothetical protein
MFSMSRGQKNLLAKMRPWVSFCRRENIPWLFLQASSSLLTRGRPDWLAFLCGSQGYHSCRFCPADFGRPNFPVPWTTRKADSVIHFIFLHLFRLPTAPLIGTWPVESEGEP